jgi:hypothetical protein
MQKFLTTMKTMNNSFQKLGVGFVFSFLIGLTSLSRASVTIVDDTSDTFAGMNASGSDPYKAQIFSVGSTGGQISSVSLDLDFTGSGANGATISVLLYNATGTAVGSEIGTLGTITGTGTGATLYSATGLASDSLTAGNDYAIVIQEANGGPSAVDWEYATSGSASTGSGSFVSVSNVKSTDGATWVNDNTHPQYIMGISVVPEPAAWGAISGISLLGLCGIRTLRERRAQTALTYGNI